MITSCSYQTKEQLFDPQKCLEIVPDRVEGLKVVSGPRSKGSIIRDMVPAVCNGHVLFNRLKSKGTKINPGSVTFQVLVEYTGEVYDVKVITSTIQNTKFLGKVSDFIMDSDFTLWGGNDADTIFLYPVEFGK